MTTVGHNRAPAAQPGTAGATDARASRREPAAKGHVAYLAKMFPRISETFILREVQTLKRAGIPLRIYSLMPPTRDRRAHADALALMAEVDVLPMPCRANLGAFFAALRRCLRRRPAATLREILRFLRRPSARTYRRLFRAVILADRLRRDRIAHLHAAWAHTPASVARIASRLVGVPWSMGAHAKDIHLSRRSSLAKKLRAARFTVTCTGANRDLLAEIAASEDSLRPAPVHMIHHGVDTSFFFPQEPDPADEPSGGAPVVLSVGRLIPKKGFDLLLAAAAQLRRRGVRFRVEIVGEGALRAELEREIARLGLGEHVRLRGMLVLDEVRAAYARAACVVLASRVTADGDRDGIPNTLAEAMACGLPVVATRHPSIQELVVGGETGLLVAPDDAGALADAIEALLQDPQRRRRMGARARASVARNFDADAWGSRLVDRFRTVRGIERILYLSADRGVPVRGSKGASVHVRSVVRALQGLGRETLVLTTRRGPKDGPDPGAKLVTCHTPARRKMWAERIGQWTRGGVPLERALLRLLDNIGLYRQGLRWGKAWHPDLLYERYALTAFAGSLIARRLRIPHILEVNAPLAEEEARFRGLKLGGVARSLEGWILRRADRVIVVSGALREHALRLGVDPRRVVILRNAIDPELFHPGRDRRVARERDGMNGRLVIGFSGTLKPWHGVHHLLNAVAQVATAVPSAQLLLIGDGPGRADLEEQARRLGLADRVRFTGAVPHEEVGELLASCDVLVAPYGPLDNHWFSPLKVAEYVAVGRPVVASAIGELKALGEARCGVVLVPPGDETTLGSALHRLATDGRHRARLAAAAASAKPWTWRDVTGQILQHGEAARREVWGWRHA